MISQVLTVNLQGVSVVESISTAGSIAFSSTTILRPSVGGIALVTNNTNLID